MSTEENPLREEGPQHKTGHSFASTAKVKNAWSFTATTKTS